MSDDNVLIRDGYTQDGYIEGVDRLHGSLEFRYRPMLPEDVEVVEAAISKAKPREGVQLLAKTIAKQLESWVRSEPPDWEHVRRLRYPVLHKLAGIVMGRQPTDASPDKQPPTADEYLASLDAPGERLAETSEGN